MNNFSLKDGFKGEEMRFADGHKNQKKKKPNTFWRWGVKSKDYCKAGLAFKENQEGFDLLSVHWNFMGFE